MQLTLSRPSAQPEPFELCTLEWRNTSGRTEPTHLIKVRRYATEAQRDAACARFTSGPSPQKSLEAMQARLRWDLENQQERLQAQLAQIQYNLDNLDTRYADVPQVAEYVVQNRFELLRQFVALRHQPGRFRFGPLAVTNDYCNAGPELFVFNLPEWDPVVQTFTAQTCEQILDLMQLAGYEVEKHWNGEGFTTWSVRVTSKTARPVATFESEAT